MTHSRALATALLALLCATSSASGSTTENASVRASIERSGWEPIALELRLRPLTLTHTSFRVDAPRLFRLPEQAPDGLALDVPLHDLFGLFLAADLDSELPRLDSVDGETYFSVGARWDLDSTVTVFVEDFMAAAAVIGSDVDLEVEPIAKRSWDGHQIAAGVLVSPHEQVTFRGEAIGYVLSESERNDGLGGTLSVTVSF